MTLRPHTLNSSHSRIGQTAIAVKLNEAHGADFGRLCRSTARVRVQGVATRSHADAAARVRCKSCEAFRGTCAAACCAKSALSAGAVNSEYLGFYSESDTHHFGPRPPDSSTGDA